MGTPDFAVPSLDALFHAGYEIVGVVTAPDRQAGRGLNLQQSAVKKYATEKGLRILQPEKLKSSEFAERLSELKADLQIVVAFRMLPEVVWNMPPMGTVNLHASLLPQYRGAAPINHALIQGEKFSGVTTFKLKHAIDTGNILLQHKVEIEPDDNAGSLHDKLMNAGATLLLKTVRGLENSTLKEHEQQEPESEIELKHAPKIYKTDCNINWNQEAEQVHDFIRGLSPYPAAYTQLGKLRIKILAAHFDTEQPEVARGKFLSDHKTYLKFAARNGFVWIDTLQPQGKRLMEVSDFLRGWRG